MAGCGACGGRPSADGALVRPPRPEESDLTQAKSGIEAAAAAVAAIGSISTWPWRPGTLRGFLSALGLPVAIWLIQALLARVLSV